LGKRLKGATTMKQAALVSLSSKGKEAVKQGGGWGGLPRQNSQQSWCASKSRDDRLPTKRMNGKKTRKKGEKEEKTT